MARPDKPPRIIHKHMWSANEPEIAPTREKMMSHIAHQSGRARGRVSAQVPTMRMAAVTVQVKLATQLPEAIPHRLEEAFEVRSV